MADEKWWEQAPLVAASNENWWEAAPLAEPTKVTPAQKPQGIASKIAEFGLDLGKRAAGAVVGGVASIPTGVQSGLRSAVRNAASADADVVMPAGVYQPGLDTDATVHGPETQLDSDKRLLQGELTAKAVRLPGADALAQAGKEKQQAINETASQATKDAVANTRITGNLLKGEIDFGKDPSLRGFVMQGADVFGSMLPVVATALVTRSPNAAGAVGGAMAAGEGAGNAKEYVAKMTDAQLQEHSPLYQRMVSAGATPAQAREIVSARAEDASALLQGAVATLGDRFTGSLVTGGLDKALTRVAGKSVLGRAAAGGALSSLEEGTQELSEGVASDIGTKAAVRNKEVGEDSAANFVLGAIGGGAPGAVRGAVARGDAPADAAAQEQQQPAPAAAEVAPVEAPPAPQADAAGAAPVGVPVEAATAAPSAADPLARLAELEIINEQRDLTPDERQEAAALLSRLDDEQDASQGTQGANGAIANEGASPQAAPDQTAEDAASDGAAASGVPAAGGSPDVQAAGIEAAPVDADSRSVLPQAAGPAPTNFWSFAKSKGLTPGQIQVGSPEHQVLKAEYDALRAGVSEPVLPSLQPPQDVNLQNRDRGRAASVVQMAEIARNPDYMRLGPSRTPDSGAPMVFAVGDDLGVIPTENFGREDMAVMSDGQRIPFRYAVVDATKVNPSNFADGRTNPDFSSGAPGVLKALNNGRTAGIRAAHEMGTAGEYVQGVQADAAMHGVSPDVVARTPNPMLVRIYADAENTAGMAAKSQGQGLGMSPAELARQDAPLLDASVLSAYQPGDVTSAANRDFVRAFVGRLNASGLDIAGMMTGDGQLSQDGRKRIQAALMQAAYGDADLVEEMFDSTDTDIKAIGEALKTMAGQWANMRDSARLGVINPEVDITQNLLQAVGLIRKARRDGVSLYDLVNQPDLMTGEPPDALTVGALRMFYSGFYLTRALGKDRLAQNLNAFVRGAMATSADAGIFGEVVSPGDILAAIIPITEGQANAEAQSEESIREPVGSVDTGGGPGEGQSGIGRPGPEEGGAGPDQDRGSEPGQNAPVGAQQQTGPGGEGSQEGDAADEGRPERGQQGGIAGEAGAVTEAPAGDGQGNPAPLLEGYTPEELAAREDAQAAAERQRASAAADAESRAQADAERDGFALTGSDRPADVLEAKGQTPMFSRSGGGLIQKLKALVAAAMAKGNENQTVVLSPVSEEEVALLQREGVPVEDGFVHTADMFAVRHAITRHGDEKTEVKQGQLPLTEEDIAALPKIIEEPDALLLGAKTKRGQDIVGSLKRLPDGTVLYLEEVRSGRKTLAMTSMRKYPGTTDFETIKNRIVPSYAQSDTGDVRIIYPDGGEGQGTQFSRSSTGAMTAAAVNQIADTIAARWDQPPPVEVVQSMQDMRVPEAARLEDTLQRAGGASGSPRGFYYRGQVFLVADGLTSVRDAAETLFHEALGHHGLRAMFGKELDGILDQIAIARPDLMKPKAEEYGKDLKVQKQRREVAEEVLAEMAQTKPELGYVKRAIAAIRTWLRQNVPGFKDLQLTDAEIIRSYILPARGWVERGAQTSQPEIAMAFDRSAPAADQTQTKAFQRWFGDSKAVDASGKPLVVYHGTGADFNVFTRDRAGATSGAANAGMGFFFTDQPEVAGRYAAMSGGAQSVMPVYLSLQNPIRLTAKNMMEADKLLQSQMKPEHDGAIIEVAMRDGGVQTVFMAKESSQVKSSTGNNGDFDPANPDIRFSRSTLGNAPGPQPQNPTPLQKLKAKALQLTSPQAITSLIYEYQDKNIDLKRLRDHIKELGGTITDLNDAYLGEELYHKRVAKRTQDFLSEELKPLLADLRARGLDLPTLEQFLHARHAPEANKVLAERNPNAQMIDAGRKQAQQAVRALELQLQRAKAQGTATKAIEDALTEAREDASRWKGAQAFQGTEDERTSLSGMSDAAAKAFMDGLQPGQRVHLDALAARVDAINAKTLDTLEKYGLMDKASMDAWRNTYQHYVPLHRDEAHPDAVSHPIGQGFSTKGAASKRRTGSNEKVTNILAHIAMQRESALTRGEKNRVAKKLYLMAAQNPDPEVWAVDKPPMTKTVDSETGFVRTNVDPTYKNKPNVVMVRISGKDQAIVFNERNPEAVRLAQSIKSADLGELNAFDSLMGKATRWLASVNTQYNPIFGIINFARDVQAAVLQLSTTPLRGQERAVAAGVPAALRGIYAEVRARRAGAGRGTGDWAKLWEEMQDEGGTTGYRELFIDPAERVKALNKEIQSLERGQASELAHAVVDWLSDYNETMENAVRLSAYKAALDQGMSKERAASLAKNLTVNFNRRGRQTAKLGAYYAFLNAAIQGSTRMVETLRGPMGKKIMLGGVMIGAVNTLIAMTMMGAGGDDDNWAKIPDFVKERSVIVPLGREDYLAIPMPLGYHVLPNMGRKAVEMMLHNDPTVGAGKHVADMAKLVLDAFNPLGGSGNVAQMIAPTPIDPAVALMMNRDWTGKPIYREDSSSLDPTPGHTRTKDTASTFSKVVSEAIVKVTGGSDYQPGAVNWTPDQLDYVIGQLTGGLGRELMKVEQTATAPFTGDELPPYKIPLVGRVYGNTRGPASESDKFYENLTKLNGVEREIKGRARDEVEVDEYMATEPLADLVGLGNSAQNQISKLRQVRREVVRQGLPGYQSEMKELNQQIGDVMKTVNQEVRRAKLEAAK